MHSNSKKYLVVNELRETVIIKRNRLIFRKVNCPHCGVETGLFESDTTHDEPKLHQLICIGHRGDTHLVETK
jgi:transposase-like protein